MQYSGINIQGSLTSSSYKCFTLEEMKMATNAFSDQTLLEGLIGKIFCGHISGSRYNGLVVVKQWKESFNPRQHEFQKEIEILSACNHPNIISLIGCCEEESEKILIYDFMKNGSLYDCLHSNSEVTPRLSVEQRLEICLGVAKGTEEYNIAPECYEPIYKVSRKAEVYAFGVVLLEVLCERPAWERLVMLALPYIWRRQLPDFTPEYVATNISLGCSRVCVYVIKDCLDNNPDNRPTINQVVNNLKSALKLQKQERQANS
ncbi:receptor-like protein kinase FERONIA [Rutidosis leptorrhynchoides]|uniref:receptor-like protein kinase FERONIA n=1 Tax=Rutidosis leptorrhynchoides TaxID=125765 RepID=UPI003A99C58D